MVSRQAAISVVRVSDAEYADLIRLRVLEASLGFVDILEARSLLELTCHNAANLKLVEEITQKAVDGGGLPQVELSRVRLDRLQTERERGKSRAIDTC